MASRSRNQFELGLCKYAKAAVVAVIVAELLRIHSKKATKCEFNLIYRHLIALGVFEPKPHHSPFGPAAQHVNLGAKRISHMLGKVVAKNRLEASLRQVELELRFQVRRRAKATVPHFRSRNRTFIVRLDYLSGWDHWPLCSCLACLHFRTYWLPLGWIIDAVKITSWLNT